MGTDSTSERLPNPQTKSRFFTLPPELRQDIYRLVFEVPTTPSGRVNLRFRPEDSSKDPTVLSILQTCAVIRNEAEDLFYNKHHIEIIEDWNATQTKYFIKFSSQDRLSAVRRLTVLVCHAEHIAMVLRSAHNFKGLSHLSFEEGEGKDPIETSSSYFKHEVSFIKKAAKRLPISLESFTLHILTRSAYFHREQEKAQAWVEMVKSLVMNSIAARRQKQVDSGEKAESDGG